MPEETPSWQLERRLWRQGFRLVAGIDEAGRGCLAGPVTAAAVILPRKDSFPYRDSKQLSPLKRQELAQRLRDEAVACSLGWATAGEIDALGRLARLAEETALVTDYLWLEHPAPVLAVARADQRSWQVAAAGILAKTARDAFMVNLEAEFPDYGFARHKGYGTRQHLEALRRMGPCREHRLSFAPVARAVEKAGEGLQCADEPDLTGRGQPDAASSE